jgi:hypothetical protein
MAQLQIVISWCNFIKVGKYRGGRVNLGREPVGLGLASSGLGLGLESQVLGRGLASFGLGLDGSGLVNITD